MKRLRHGLAGFILPASLKEQEHTLYRIRDFVAAGLLVFLKLALSVQWHSVPEYGGRLIPSA